MQRIEDHLGIARKVAGCDGRTGTQKDDNYQNALVGVWNAIEAFDESRGVNFSTLAFNTARNSMLRGYEKNGAVTVTRYMRDKYGNARYEGFDTHEHSEEPDLAQQVDAERIRDEMLRTKDGRMVLMFLEGYTYAEVQEEFKVSRATLDRVIQRYRYNYARG